MSVQVTKDILEFWDEKSFNPSSRHQKQIIPNLENVILEKIEKELFSKFPELVAGNVQVEVLDDVQLNMVNMYISWRVWMPTAVKGKIVTLENMKSIIKIQFFTDILENKPVEYFATRFEEALDMMEEQMDKVKFEFYKKGIDTKVVAPYLRKYAKGKIIQVPINSMKVIP
jgi:hypothetical protein